MPSVKISGDTTEWERSIAKMEHSWEGGIKKMQMNALKFLGPMAALNLFQSTIESLKRAHEDMNEATKKGLPVSEWLAIQRAAKETGFSTEDIVNRFSELPEYVRQAVAAQKQMRAPLDSAGAMRGKAGQTLGQWGGVLMDIVGTDLAMKINTAQGLAAGTISGLYKMFGYKEKAAQWLEKSKASMFSNVIPDQISNAAAAKSFFDKRDRSKRFEEFSNFNVRALDELNRMGGFSQRGATPPDETVSRIAAAVEKTAENTESLKE